VRRTTLVALLAALALAGLAVAAVVRRYRPGRVDTGSAAVHGATIARYDIRSRFVHETLPQTAVAPAGGYWHAHYAGYLRFYADALASC
jgi:hypothetical protein